MKNKLIFALTFLISVVIVRILLLYVLKMPDLSPILVAIAFILILRDKFSIIHFKRFNPVPFFAIIIITYILLFLTIIILTQFKWSEVTKPENSILIFIMIAFIDGLSEETAWRGYLFSKLKELTWLQITIIINLIWAIWHLPSHYFSLEGHIWISFPLFIVSCFELGIIMQYLRVKTGSVIPCILFHALFIIPLMLSNLKTKILYLGSFPSIIMLLLLLPISIYCYRAGQRLHDTKKQLIPITG
jgi:membrane protease YdiL (CAAX protease family)